MNRGRQASELFRKGVQARHRGDAAAAAGCFEQAVWIAPDDAEARRELALALSIAGDRRRAVDEMRKALEHRPAEARWHYDLGDLLARAGEAEQAPPSFERAAQLDPRDALYPGRLAALTWRLRKKDEAVRWAERALEIDPRQEMAREVLARAAIESQDAERAERLLQSLIGNSRFKATRATAWRLLGKVRERQGRWGEAFDAHQAANTIHLDTPEAKQALKAPIEAMLPPLVTDQAAALYRKWGERRYEDGIPAPVVLTGFPRSGTTLMEQVLAAHPRMTSADERPLLIDVRRAIASGRPPGDIRTELEVLDGLGDADILELRGLYRRALEESVAPELRGRLIVDKHPFRLLDLGVMSRIFPEMRMIVMIRDPRDVCLSALFQGFEINPAMVRFLTPELCGEWYVALMGFWRAIRGMMSADWIEVRYETLVADFEPEARRAVSFAGEEWNERVARFHEFAADRVVLSASSEQVAEKLNARSIGRWMKYADRLGPVLDRVDPFVEAWGFEPTPR